MFAVSRSGGIGRRAGFKIPSWQQGEGSSPSSGIFLWGCFGCISHSTWRIIAVFGVFSQVAFAQNGRIYAQNGVSKRW